MPGLYTGAQGLFGGFAGLLYGTGLSTPPGLLADGGFSPISLFAGNVPGVWYDPSDLSTLYQDAAGTTPVTAVEQPVGLMLDKSRGLVLGAELVSNGGFDADSNWTKAAGATISSGAASYSGTAITGDIISQNISVVQGRSYLVQYTFSSITGFASARIGGVNGTFYGTAGTRSEYIVAGATGSVAFAITGRATGATQITIDNISVRELPGSHASQSTSASRPVLSARYNGLVSTEDLTAAAWTKTGVTITANAITAPDGTDTADLVSGGGNWIAQNSTLTGQANQSVTGGAWVRGAAGVTTVTVRIDRVGVAQGNQTVKTISPSAWTWITHAVTLDANTAAPALRFDLTGGNIYVWGADLRVTNDGVGLPSYQRVTTSTDYDTTGFPMYLRGDGTDDVLLGPAISNVISASAYEACVGARFNAVTTNSSDGWLNQSLVTDSAGYVGIGFARSTGVIGIMNYDANGDEATTSLTIPSTIVLQQRHSGGNIVISTNGGTEASAASGNTGALTGSLQLLKAFGAVYTNGRLYGVIIRNTAFTDAERVNARTWMNGKTRAF